MDVDSGNEQPQHGEDDSDDGDQSVAESLDQQRHHGATGEGEEDEDGAGEGCLCSANIESSTDSREENTKGVGESLLDEGDHEGGGDYKPSNAASIRSSLFRGLNLLCYLNVVK